MIRAVCIGHATYDITIRTGKMPIEGELTRYEHKIGCTGGKAAIMSLLLAKWGIEPTLCSVVGADNHGQAIKKDLDASKVDTRCLETTYDNETDMRINIIDEKTNKNKCVELADNYTYLKKYEFDFSPDIIITDAFDTNASKVVLGQYPKAISLLYADRVNSNVLDLCKRVHFIICSKEFAENMAGEVIDLNKTSTLIGAYEKIKSKYSTKQIVITLGDKGALYCINGQIKISPALKVDVKDTMGVGAIFRAAFIYTIVHGGDIEKAVKYGNIAAGISTNKIGARLSIPTLTEVNNFYEKNYQ